MSERYFTETDGRDLQIYEEPGLYVVGSGRADDEYAGHLAGHQSVWWHEVSDGALEDAALERRALDVNSITVAPSRTPSFSRRLGVVFADHLASYRSRNPDISWPCVISPERPDPPAECVRLPHLVAVGSDSSVQDTVMWELLNEEEAAIWLKQPLPEQGSIEDRLRHILFLRRLVREQVQLNSEPYREVTQRLAAGRYLSILFVYQHADLFLELFEGEQWQEISSANSQA